MLGLSTPYLHGIHQYMCPNTNKYICDSVTCTNEVRMLFLNGWHKSNNTVYKLEFSDIRDFYHSFLVNGFSIESPNFPQEYSLIQQKVHFNLNSKMYGLSAVCSFLPYRIVIAMTEESLFYSRCISVQLDH